MTYLKQVSYQNTPQIDAFARLRVSNPVTLFDATNQYDKSPLYWDQTLAGGGAITHLPNESSVQMSTGDGNNGSKAYRYTREYFRYQPGKSQLVLITSVMGALKANVRQRLGFFDTNNGVFFEQDGVNLKVVRRSFTSGAAVDTAVNQGSWNVDKCDGTGPSAFNFNPANANIFFIDFEWLGAGRVRMGFFNELGMPIVCHEFRNANSLTTVFMTTANLPVQYQVENTGAAGSLTIMKAICSTVISEGGFEDERAATFTANNGTTAITVTTRRAILSIRPKATFNSIVNRASIRLLNMVLRTITNDCLWELVYNPTFTVGGGALTWADVDTTYSAVERCVHGDANAGAITGGYVIASGYGITGGGSGANAVAGAATPDLLARLPLTLDSAGANPIALSLVCTSLTGNSVNAGALGWKEIK
jgi:hypothetical protein